MLHIFQIWRKQGIREYILVGQTVYRGLESGPHDFKIPSEDRFQFEAGDVLGIMFEHFNPIPYDVSQTDCQHDQGILYTDATSREVLPGRSFNFHIKPTFFKPCRQHSLYATFQPISEL